MESPVDVTVNESESATFTCAASHSSGDLTIEWICSDGSNCGTSSTDDSNDGDVTSTFVINNTISNLTVTCVVNLSLPDLSSGESNDVEVRPPPAEALWETAQLIVIPAPTTTTTGGGGTTKPPTSNDPSNGELKINYTLPYRTGNCQPQKCFAHHPGLTLRQGWNLDRNV